MEDFETRAFNVLDAFGVEKRLENKYMTLVFNLSTKVEHGFPYTTVKDLIFHVLREDQCPGSKPSELRKTYKGLASEMLVIMRDLYAAGRKRENRKRAYS